MKVPPVTTETWKKLVDAAERFRALQPWDELDDDAMFGVQDPGSDQVGWCCVLGAMSEVFALCVYRGSEGLDFYRRIQSGEIDPEIDDVFALQDCLMAEFCERGELEKEDLAVLKAVGFKPHKSAHSPAYPQFRSHAPGFAPWFLTEQEAQFLTFALDCAVDATETVEEDGEDVLKGEEPGTYLVYLPKRLDDGSLSWIKRFQRPAPFHEPEPPVVPVDELRLRKVKNQPLRQDGPWEADTFYLGSGVIMDRDRPYWGRGTMIAHHESGYILGVEVFQPEADPYVALRDAIFAAIEKHGSLPSDIQVKDELAWEALKPLADQLGIRLRMKRMLPMILEAKQAMREDMREGLPREHRNG